MRRDSRQLDLFAETAEVTTTEEREAQSSLSSSESTAGEQRPAAQMELPSWLMRDRDLVIRASAGTGKTETLTELYVHWVAGLGGPALRPSQILATTFTEKAAEEMRARISAALLDIVDAAGKPERCETRIARLVCERVPSGSLDAKHFLQSAAELSEAPLGTFHSLCGGWLRLHADAVSLPAGFEVLTEFESERLRHDAIVVALRELVRANEAVRDLLGDFRSIEGDFSLIAVLEPLMLEIIEQGGARAGMWGESEAVQSVDALQTSDLRSLWQRLIQEHLNLALIDVRHGSSRKVYEKVAQLAHTWEKHPRAEHVDVALLVDVAFALDTACGKGKASEEVEAQRVRKQIIESWAAHARRTRCGAVRLVIEAAIANYEQSKRSRGMVDFADLLVQTRQLLANDPVIRAQFRSQFKAVLVDEFQDTNQVQRDLVLLLREGKRGGFAVVGDRKQSIYGFRGADITVYEGLARNLLDRGAREHVLDQSYRSQPELLEVINALSEAALDAAALHRPEEKAELPFEMRFERDKEALKSARQSIGSGAAVTLIEPLDDVRPSDQEPVAVARHIAQQVRSAAWQVERNGTVRPANFSDVALLLPRFTKLGDFTRALDREGVPYSVLKGRGLLSTIEARDILSLAALLVDLDDGRGLLAVLRGPMLQLSESELHSLVTVEPRVFRLPLEQVDWTDMLGAERAVWMQRLLRHRRNIDRVGLSAALSDLLELASYRAILGVLPSGAQRVANVDRICTELLVREGRGENPRSLLREFRARALRELDPEADVVGAQTDAVSIMTVHQSKGLQFPVVVAADLGRQVQVPNEKILYDRDAPGGVAVSVRGPGRWVDGPHYEAVRAVAKARAHAEAARLFYVQITRARDHLVLSGLGRSKHSLRRAVVDPVIEQVPSRLVQCIGVPNAPVVPLTESPKSAAARQAIAVVGQPRVQLWEVSVTMLEEFARCPRRFNARSLLGELYDPVGGLPSDSPVAPDSSEQDARQGVDARTRGTVLHWLLEHADWNLMATSPEQAERTWQRALSKLSLPESDQGEMLLRMRAFFQSRYAKSLASELVRIRREQPFALSFGVAQGRVIVRGQVDLIVEHEDGVHIIDYKSTSPYKNAPVAPYAFQLAAYALGYHQATQGRGSRKEVSAGIWFVDGKSRDPVFDDLNVGKAVRDMPEVVESFAKTMASQQFAGRGIDTCRALACPLIETCHASDLQ